MKKQEALEQISYLKKLTAQTRLQVAVGYPYFLLWGLVWILGYSGALWLPASLVPRWWPLLIGAGWLGTLLIFFFHTYAFRKEQPVIPPLLKKLGWLGLTLSILAGYNFSLLARLTGSEQILQSFWPLQIGVIYIALGIFIGRRIVLTGGWLVVTGIAALWLPAPLREIWLAFGGGGGLFLTGIFLRKQAFRGE